MTTDKRFTAADVGCYLDGAMGWHNTYRVVELAQSFGFELDKEGQAELDLYRNGEGDLDIVSEIADEATEYLQSNTDDGLEWQWDAGELSLMPVDEDGNEIYS